MKLIAIISSLILSLTAMALPQGVAAKGNGLSASQTVPADSDTLNFVRASIVIGSPDAPLYSAFGHCAIRMQCPSAGLDYCFSLELEPTAGNYIKYFSGKTKAGMYADPTKDYIEMFRKEGRGIEQYELNLTLPEKRLLWKHLDEDMMQGAVHDFNLISTNCVQASFLAIVNSLITDSIDYTIPPSLYWKSGRQVRNSCRFSPWGEFLLMSIAGGASDMHAPLANSLSPETLVQLFERSRLVDIKTGQSRPMFRYKPTTLLQKKREPQASWLTPLVFFSILLVITVAITIGEKRLGWRKPAMVADTLLFVFQTLVGILFVYMAISSNIFGTRWNWYLIPFNPLPAILWLLCRKKNWYHKTYLAYTVVLLLFICATPLSLQLDIPHAILCATMAVRTASHIETGRKKQRKTK